MFAFLNLSNDEASILQLKIRNYDIVSFLFSDLAVNVKRQITTACWLSVLLFQHIFIAVCNSVLLLSNKWGRNQAKPQLMEELREISPPTSNTHRPKAVKPTI